MKVAVIGGGSTYTPELINGLLARTATLPVTELVLMDIDPQRLEIVGGFAQRMVAAYYSRQACSSESAGAAPFRVTLTDNQREAVRDASYVCTQLRVGQMEARRADEYLGQRHGLIGQETTGVGGMAKALRTIPVLLQLARNMQELAPGALLVNFTNPAGLVTEALSRYAPAVSAVGVCNVPLNTKMHLLGLLEQELGAALAPERTELKTLGLNHLSWHNGFTLDGEDMWATVFERYCAEQEEWSQDTLRALQRIPNYYLHYYYHTAQKLAEQKSWPPSRAEQVQAIERDLLAYYANPEHVEPPADLMKRGGAYYSTVATQLLNAHYNDLNETHVVNVRHAGAVEGWDRDWVLEMPGKVNRAGIRPLPAAPLPPACYGLLTQVKMYELLTVEAAVHGNRRAAYEALLAHPLGPPADQVQNVLDDMLATNRQYLPQFG